MKEITNIKNKKFGFLTPIEQVRINGKVKWKCVCDCGNIVYREYRLLNYNQKKGHLCSCGCKGIIIDGELKPIVGQDFGTLKVISYNNETLLYKCIDFRGKELFLEISNVRFRISNSDNVIKKEKSKLEKAISYNCKSFKEYSEKRRRLRGIWTNIKERCYDANTKSYIYYGARGIKMCEEWKTSFENFFNWSAKNGYEYGLQIDRIDNDGDYCPNNCRWVTQQVNANNKTSNLYIEYKNRTQTLKQWCVELNLPYRQTHKRIYTFGWSIERAFNLQSNNNRLFCQDNPTNHIQHDK